MADELSTLISERFVTADISDMAIENNLAYPADHVYKPTSKGKAYAEKVEHNILYAIITVVISAFILLINILNRYD